MKNVIDHGALDVDRGVFSLNKFFESDAPGTLSWLNMEDIECISVVPPFNITKLSKQVIPCHRQCAGCRRWQIESFCKLDFLDNSNFGIK